MRAEGVLGDTNNCYFDRVFTGPGSHLSLVAFPRWCVDVARQLHSLPPGPRSRTQPGSLTKKLPLRFFTAKRSE